MRFVRVKSAEQQGRLIGVFARGQGDRSTSARSPPLADPLALIRKRELAALLGVNPWTIDNWRKRGLIPPPIVLSPQVVAWRRSDIERWLVERELQPAATREQAQRAEPVKRRRGLASRKG
jgi:predicted DNA-binding transcriptional regulator AlpA